MRVKKGKHFIAFCFFYFCFFEYKQWVSLFGLPGSRLNILWCFGKLMYHNASKNETQATHKMANNNKDFRKPL
ncbi:MAG: hypothetical protein R3309_05835, partial [Reinekea sp.]|nr:hypothetical protein [Reinekea sp.]